MEEKNNSLASSMPLSKLEAPGLGLVASRHGAWIRLLGEGVATEGQRCLLTVEFSDPPNPLLFSLIIQGWALNPACEEELLLGDSVEPITFSSQYSGLSSVIKGFRGLFSHQVCCLVVLSELTSPLTCIDGSGLLERQTDFCSRRKSQPGWHS